MQRIGKIHTTFLSENIRRRDCSENHGVDGKTLSEWIVGKKVGKVWIGFIWLRVGTSGGFL